MENLALVEHPSTAVNVTVRRPSSRPREYLTEREVEKLIDAASENRWGHRDATAILIAYRHGLRSSELVTLRWDDFDLNAGKLHVRRFKDGQVGVHPVGGRELGPCDGSSGNLHRAFTSSSPSAWPRLVWPVISAWLRGQASTQAFRSSSIATCCAIRAGTSLPMTVRTRARSSTTWVTSRSTQRCATRH